MSESLRSLSDQDVISRTEALVARERKLTLSVLLHLNEIERRQLYLRRGYGTLFSYCTASLGYSAGAAMRRIQAARCIASYPEVQGLLEVNQVNLSTIGLVAGVMKPENKDELLGRIRGKSQREVEAIAVEYDPKTAVPRDRIKTIAVVVPTANFRSGNGPGEVKAAEQVDTQPSDKAPNDGAPQSGLGLGFARLERRAWVQFAADQEFMALLHQVKSLAGHRLPANGTLEDVFGLLMRYFILHEDPKARQERREARKASMRTRHRATHDSSRHIPAEIRDQVFQRDKGQCTFLGSSGRRCGSTHVLQVDHIVPIARGGKSTLENLRLLCAKHNRLEAERIMGTSRVKGQNAPVQV